MSIQPPLVSIAITTYNREDYLETAIESVLKQTYPNFELLIWDDGSTDRTLEVAQNAVRKFARADQQVKVIGAPHQGRVAALQAAIAQTHGTYLGWVDSDDWLAPTALEQTAVVLDDNPAVGMVYTDYVEVDPQGKIVGYGQRCQSAYSKDRLLLDFMTFHFRLIRRSVFDQVGGIDCSLDDVEDYDLCLRLSEVTQVQRVRQPLYHYRIHAHSLSQQWQAQQVLRSHVAMKRALERRGLATQYEIEANLLESRFYLKRKRPVMYRKVAAVLPFLATLPLISALSGGMAQAQIVPAPNDAGTIVTPNGNRLDITGGTLSRDQLNLFHSFSQFGLSREQIANFLANPALANILVRVNGGNASVIDGLLRVSGGHANLFFMNPSGIIFGANARLDVPGSFTATTANGIGFRSGWFNALGTNDYAALVGLPSTFAFTAQPGSIVNAGSLAVGTGQSLTLLGGTVVNTGTLDAPGGQVTIAAIPGDRVVQLSQPGDVLQLEIQTTAAVGSVPNAWTFPVAALPQLLTGAGVGVQTGLTASADGTVQVAGAGTVIPTDAGTAIAAGTVNVSGIQGGEVNVLGSKVGLLGASIDASGMNGGGLVRIGGDYQGKGTVPNATRTFVSSDSVINANALSGGNGGRIIVWADQATGFYGNINARGGLAQGNGGFVEVSGKETLAFRGDVNLSALNGIPGSLLLDPSNINIVAGDGAGQDNQDTALPTILASAEPTVTFTISQNALQSQTGAVILQATNNITIQTLNNGGLSFQPSSGSIEFTAGGSFSMDQRQSITTQGRNLTISGADVTTGSIITTGRVGGNGNNRDGEAGGMVTLTADSGNLTIGSIKTSGGPANPTFGSGGAGGMVTLTADSGIVTVGSITTTGGNGSSRSGGAGGTVTSTARGTITTSRITTSGGDAGSGYGSTGGTGGAVKLTANSGIVTTDRITTSGGAGGTGQGSGFPGGTGGTGGEVTLKALSGSLITQGITTSSITTTGGDGGTGGDDFIGGDGGTGGQVRLTVNSGGITVANITTSGGNGNNGGDGNDGGNGTAGQTGGNGGNGGTVKLTANLGSLTAASIITTGGNGGTGGNGVTGGGFGTAGGTGGIGGTGGQVILTTPSGNLTTADITASGGAGSDGGGGGIGTQYGAGGNGGAGGSGNQVTLMTPSGKITTQGITTSSGAGGNGTASSSRRGVNGVSGDVGGNVTLDPSGDIQVGFIDARGRIDGGTVTISTDRFFRATGVIPSLPGVSISTAGSSNLNSGSITITHGGGLLVTAFTVGVSVSAPDGNGTAGAITTGINTIFPFQSFLGNYTLGNAAGIIRIITSLPPSENPLLLEKPPEGMLPSPFSPPTPLPCSSSITAAVEGKFAQQYEKSLGSRLARKTVLDACEVLRSIQASTGVRPGIIYAVFVPPEVDPKDLKVSAEQSPKDYLALILITPKGGEVVSVREAKRADVKATAEDFRAKVIDIGQGDAYKTPGEKLYNWLIAPLLTELQKQGTENLTFILDEGLRTIPLAALYGSKAGHVGHLIEQGFSVGMMPSLNLTDTRYAPIRNVSMLAVGRSDFTGRGLTNLPTVPTELNLLTQRVWNRSGNEQLLDPKDNIDPDLLAKESGKEFGIIHISTHAQFKAEDSAASKTSDQVPADLKNEPAPPQLRNSFIQLSGTNVLRLDQFRTLGLDKPPRELLVLSACQTALGDPEAELGFAGLATQSGVKSALGSLWRADEGGSLALMTEFYQQLPAARIKAEALQQAQLNMIGKKVRIQKRNSTGTELIWTKGAEPLPVDPQNPNPQIPDFTHPHYWAGFTLVGNPW